MIWNLIDISTNHGWYPTMKDPRKFFEQDKSFIVKVVDKVAQEGRCSSEFFPFPNVGRISNFEDEVLF